MKWQEHMALTESLQKQVLILKTQQELMATQADWAKSFINLINLQTAAQAKQVKSNVLRAVK